MADWLYCISSPTPEVYHTLVHPHNQLPNVMCCRDSRMILLTQLLTGEVLWVAATWRLDIALGLKMSQLQIRRTLLPSPISSKSHTTNTLLSILISLSHSLFHCIFSIRSFGISSNKYEPSHTQRAPIQLCNPRPISF